MKREVLAAAMIIVWLFYAAYVVLATAQAFEPRKVAAPEWQPPDIPECDAELWDRVRGECGETG